MARKLVVEREAGTEQQPLLPIEAPRRQRDRVGKRTIAAHFDPAIGRAVAILAAKEDRTMASLLTEAVEDLLKKYKQDINER